MYTMRVLEIKFRSRSGLPASAVTHYNMAHKPFIFLSFLLKLLDIHSYKIYKVFNVV